MEDVPGALEGGCSCWVDLDLTDGTDVESCLRVLGINVAVISGVMTGSSVGRHDVYDECLHVTVAAPRLESGQIHFDNVDLILGERLLITIHRGEPLFVRRVRQNYSKFFQRFAQSIGFLLFEIWDSVIDTHRSALAELEAQVEQTQRSIFETSDDAIFGHVGNVGASLLDLRKNVLAIRDALDQLATHRSAFVPETTQPYLRNMVGMLNRLADDLTVERETLAESLTLYLGIVSHRTNRLLHRLTLVSVIFLPLMFLCGVYGTNFALPEFEWEYGYLYFWGLALVTVSCVVALTRLQKMW